jgi:hypothetical protein
VHAGRELGTEGARRLGTRIADLGLGRDDAPFAAPTVPPEEDTKPSLPMLLSLQELAQCLANRKWVEHLLAFDKIVSDRGLECCGDFPSRQVALGLWLELTSTARHAILGLKWAWLGRRPSQDGLW